MQPLNDERFAREALSGLMNSNNYSEYSYLAGHLMEMISYVEPNSEDEKTLFGYIANYLRLRKSWKDMEESTNDLYKEIELGAATKAIDAVIEFCEKWGINVVCYQDEYSISGNITRPKDQ